MKYMDHFLQMMAIYITTRNQRVAARALQEVTNKLFAWAADRRLTFSTSKTVSMIFKREEREMMNQLKTC